MVKSLEIGKPDAAKFLYTKEKGSTTIMGKSKTLWYSLNPLKYRETEGIKLQIGLAETLQILIGCDHTTEKGMELAKRIEQLFKDRCAEFKKKYKLNFGVYYTPNFLWAA